MDENNKFPFFIVISLFVILAIILGFHARRDLMVLLSFGMGRDLRAQWGSVAQLL